MSSRKVCVCDRKMVCGGSVGPGKAEMGVKNESQNVQKVGPKEINWAVHILFTRMFFSQFH